VPAAAPTTAALYVFAAASLTAVVQRRRRPRSRPTRPARKVALNFAGSRRSCSRSGGRPADVFASADEANMQKLVDAGPVAGTPQIFARNLLQIVVAKGNPQHIAGLADLARPGLIVVLCGETVPCGRYALEAFRRPGHAPAGSREPDVKGGRHQGRARRGRRRHRLRDRRRAAADKVEGVGSRGSTT
jgi:molybdate transport system substrate-binding protein